MSTTLGDRRSEPLAAAPPESSGELSALLAQAARTEDFSAYMSLCRRRRRLSAELDPRTAIADLRIAVLGGATTDFLEQPLQLELETIGVRSRVMSAGFNTYPHEMLDPGSGTAAFGPDLAILLLTPFNVPQWPQTGSSEEAVQQLARQTAEDWLALCASLHTNAGCELIVTNLHLLPLQVMGNLGCRTPWERNSFIRRVNAELARRAPSYVHIFDVETLAAMYGVRAWFDDRYWLHAKQPVSFACVVPFVRSLAGLIGAIYGRTAKCLVLDLDNTLWGGVVGDDGVEGLRIGEGSPEAEAFKAFQAYLLQLKARGLLLAVASKNEPDTALAAFSHPEMLLKRSDFAAFKAHWEPKPASLEEIARELNIGLDAIVFVDDNPAERELVRQMLPQVKVVELSADPADYPRLLDRSGWLELARWTDEDRSKSEQYAQNAERRRMEGEFADYAAYLASLDQRAVLGRFSAVHLDRITQLINKTNQFNLTARRMTASEVEALAARADAVTLYVRLADRFGDNGLISVLAAERAGDDVLEVGLWLMSCRVFKRGVEQMVANQLFEQAKAMGVRRVRGLFTPTGRNGLAARLYPDLGFELERQEPDGRTIWILDVDRYQPASVAITSRWSRDGQ